jgi:hypothetical protein
LIVVEGTRHFLLLKNGTKISKESHAFLLPLTLANGIFEKKLPFYPDTVVKVQL